MSWFSSWDRNEPTIAEGTAIIIKDLATLNSIKCSRKYPTNPEVKPNVSVSFCNTNCRGTSYHGNIMSI